MAAQASQSGGRGRAREAMPLLARVWFRLFWQTYDALGGWLVVCLLSTLASFPIVTAPLAWSGLLACAVRMEEGREIGPRAWWAGVRRHAGRSLLMGLLTVLVPLLLWVNVNFYAGAPSQALPPLLRAALLGLVGWIGLLALLAIQLGWAFLVLQDLTVGKALRRGLLVVAAHPFTTLMVAATALGVTLLMGVTGIGVLVLLGALLANLAMGMAAAAIEFHEEREEQAEYDTLNADPWRNRPRLQELDESRAERTRRYQRSLRELLKPWEMR